MIDATALALIATLRDLAARRERDMPDSRSDYQRGYRCGGSHAFAQAADMIEAAMRPAEGTLLSCEYCGSEGGGCNICTWPPPPDHEQQAAGDSSSIGHRAR